MSLTVESAAPTLVVNGTRIDMIERGSGRPLLFLHPENGIEPALAAIDALAKGGARDRADASGFWPLGAAQGHAQRGRSLLFLSRHARSA